MKHIRNILFISLIITIGFSSCSQSKKLNQGMHPLLYSTLYQQQAAEFQALCYQAYNLAELRMQEHLQKTYNKPLAVVVDIDETVLDNSPYEAEGILKGFSYPVRWDEWMYKASAIIIPGSLDFLKSAEAKGVEVFYVSNRREVYREATLKNLQEKGFPFADDAHLFLKTELNEKQSRRNKINESHEIILLIGDNLGDFDGIFETNIPEQRMQQTLDNHDKFGDRWIVLPNAVYGDWVNMLPGHKYGLSEKELYKSLLQGLKGF